MQSRKKEIIKVRAEINEIEKTKIQKNDKTESNSLKSSTKSMKP